MDAHRYVHLAGETPAQDVAVLRLMLAVLQTVFSRVDVDGSEKPFEDPDNALDRWEAIWNKGAFPATPLKDYRDLWHERFYLFHPTRPFYQCPSAEIGTQYSAAKFNGQIQESANKIRLFSDRQKEGKSRVTIPEAARWLLHLIAFDDTSAKPKGKNLPSVGAGWLGKLGIVYVQGDNLFETLMLNLTFLDDSGNLWDYCRPIWENTDLKEEERTQVPLPNDPASLLTLQSRRVILHRDGDYVTSLALLGGDFFEKQNAFVEQMTMWREVRDKKTGTISGFVPRRHDPSKQIWREFSSIIHSSGRMPGVIAWITLLKNANCMNANRIIRISTVCVKYGDKDFFVENVGADSLDLHLSLFGSISFVLRNHIEDTVAKIEKAAYYTGRFGSALEQLAGGNKEAGNRSAIIAAEEFYSRIDGPFRQWLYNLKADESDVSAFEAWNGIARRIALSLGDEMVNRTSASPLTRKKYKTGDAERITSVPEAYAVFQMNIRSEFKTGFESRSYGTIQ